MTPRHLAERAAQFIFCAARDDLDDIPYTLHMTELPPPFDSLPVGGWVGPADDLRFRDQIDDLIGWTGRGPLIVLSGESWPAVAAVAVHEAAHLVETDWTFSNPDERPVNETLAVLGMKLLAEEASGTISREMHGLRFHRSLSHLLARIPFDRENLDIDLWLCCGDIYGYPDWPTIRRTFSQEVWERRHEPIRSILESDPPPESVRLFCE
jgi:hypothetical protein